jgi:putative PIN family toxin of toxin-antitoxin system
MKGVIDTNVLVSALRSKKGASHEVVRRAFIKDFETALSLPLYLEYADVLTRPGLVPLSTNEAVEFCQDIASIAIHHKIHFLWRPFLTDPKDDLVLELAVASGSSHIITHNLGHFRPAIAFQVKAIRPAEFLSLL